MEVETVLTEYKKSIWGIIMKFLIANKIPTYNADDVFQEVSIRLFQKLPSYDPTRSGLRHFVLANTEIVCLRFRQDYYRHDTTHENEDFEVLACSASSDTMFTLIDESSLSEFDKQIVVGKLLGYTQQELAITYEISQSKVSRILRKFRDEFAEMIRI
jgi:RNA polymerase sigma factor (sigma-70 family)